MRDVGAEYERLLAGAVDAAWPGLPFFSVSAKQVRRAGQLGPASWRVNLESPMLFAPADRLMLHAAPRDTVYVEVGPLRDVFRAAAAPTVATYVPTLVRGEPGACSKRPCPSTWPPRRRAAPC